MALHVFCQVRNTCCNIIPQLQVQSRGDLFGPVSERLAKRRTMLIVVKMQNTFAAPGSVTPVVSLMLFMEICLILGEPVAHLCLDL